ncbi:MAG: hypothetical protein JWN30_2136 [Bacilli bacterium]|nr:hypothetical protein [Bacilli bacterium]
MSLSDDSPDLQCVFTIEKLIRYILSTGRLNGWLAAQSSRETQHFKLCPSRLGLWIEVYQVYAKRRLTNNPHASMFITTKYTINMVIENSRVNPLIFSPLTTNCERSVLFSVYQSAIFGQLRNKRQFPASSKNLVRWDIHYIWNC